MGSSAFFKLLHFLSIEGKGSLFPSILLEFGSIENTGCTKSVSLFSAAFGFVFKKIHRLWVQNIRTTITRYFVPQSISTKC